MELIALAAAAAEGEPSRAERCRTEQPTGSLRGLHGGLLAGLAEIGADPSNRPARGTELRHRAADSTQPRNRPADNLRMLLERELAPEAFYAALWIGALILARSPRRGRPVPR